MTWICLQLNFMIMWISGLAGSVLIWPKSEEKIVQLVRGSYFKVLLSKQYVSGILSKSSVFSTSKDVLFQGYVSHVCYEFCSTDRCNFFNSGFTTENSASSNGCRIPQKCNHFFNVVLLMIIINKFV